MSRPPMHHEFPLPAELSARFHVLAQIGVGGHASVFSASSRSDPDSRYAIKVLHEPVADADRRRRFDRECEALRRLVPTASIIELIDAGVEDGTGRAFVVTPLYPGTLADRLSSLGRLPVDEVLAVGESIAAALGQAHAVEIVHRDIKPSNIFVDDVGGVLLGDFGAAQLMDDLTLSGSLSMSVAYAAPETVETGTTSVASDLYGLGVTLYQLLTGRLPVSTTASPAGEQSIAALVRGVVTDAPAPISTADAPPALVSVIERLLEKDPRHRYSSAADVQRDLAAVRHDPLRMSRTHRSHSGRWVGLSAVAVGLFFVGAIAVMVDPVGNLAGSDSGDDASEAPRPTVDPLDASAPNTTASEPGTAVESPVPLILQESVDTGPDSPSDDLSSSEQLSLVTPCDTSGHLLCEDFESGVSDWYSMRRADVSTLEVVDVNATSGDWSLELVPRPGTTEMSSFLEAELEVPPGSEELNAVVHVNFDLAGASDDWLTNVITIRGPDERFWVVQALQRPGQRIGFGLQSWKDGAELTAVAERSFDASSWRCVRMVVAPDAASVMTLYVDDELVARIDEPLLDATITGEFLVAAGGSWWASSGGSPRFLTDDLIVALDDPGCS